MTPRLLLVALLLIALSVSMTLAAGRDTFIRAKVSAAELIRENQD